MIIYNRADNKYRYYQNYPKQYADYFLDQFVVFHIAFGIEMRTKPHGRSASLLPERLLQVCDNVVGIFYTAGEADKSLRDAGLLKLFA